MGYIAIRRDMAGKYFSYMDASTGLWRVARCTSYNFPPTLWSASTAAQWDHVEYNHLTPFIPQVPLPDHVDHFMPVTWPPIGEVWTFDLDAWDSGSTLEAQLTKFELQPSHAEFVKLLRYIAALERWNRTINLTALKGAALIRRLVVEPLWVLEQLSPSGRYIDIGSGNGSPAVPWYIRGGFLAADLVEARTRRATFLHQIARQLDLERITVHRGRYEDLGADLQPPNWVTLQGVRLTGQLLEQIRPKAPQTTTAIWFTKAAQPPASPARILEIPFSDRRALIFKLEPRTSSGSTQRDDS